MGLKVLQFDGVDYKKSDLVRPDESLSDVLNAEFAEKGGLKGRSGFTEVVAETNDSIESLGIRSFYAKNQEKLFVFGKIVDPIKVYSNNALYKELSNVGVVTDACEYQGSVYLATSAGVYKFDGEYFYKAGLPSPGKPGFGNAPYINGASTSDKRFWRIWYSYYDWNGVEVNSPSSLIENTIDDNDVVSIYVSHPYQLGFTEFFNYYIEKSASAAQTLDISHSTIDAKTNYAIGHKVKVLTDSENEIVLTITNKTATTVAFDTSAMGAEVVTFVSLSKPIMSNRFLSPKIRANVAVARGADVGHKMVGTFDLWPDVTSVKFEIDFTSTTGYTPPEGGAILVPYYSVRSWKAPFAGADEVLGYVEYTYSNTSRVDGVLASSIYSIFTSKLMPPVCKTICAYGAQLVFGDISGFYNFENTFQDLTGQHIFMWSDTGVGDGGETFTALNRDIAGEPDNQRIRAIRRVNDSVVIFKDESVFTVDGYLIEGQYQLRRISANNIGCTNKGSIVEYENSILFLAHNGIYITDGLKSIKFSEKLDPIFNERPKEGESFAVRFKSKEKIIFFCKLQTKDIVAVWDYHYMQWMIWDNIDFTNGCYEDIDGFVYFIDSTRSLMKFTDARNDNGVAINSKICTNWHTIGEPSLLKKFIGARVFSLGDSADTQMSMSVQKNWTNTDVSSVSFSLGSTTKTIQKKFDMQNAYSLRIIFEHNVLNEDFYINGYELDYEVWGAKDKN